MEYLKIGKIVNTRGLKGELKVKTLTDFQMDRYQSGNTIYIQWKDSYIPFEVKQYRQIKHIDCIVLVNHEDINLVEKFKGCFIYVPYDEEVSLQEDEFHLSELIDLPVYQAKKMVGHIQGIRTLPQGDYLEIQTNDSGLKLVPFREEFVPVVDLEDGYVEIIDMEGLL